MLCQRYVNETTPKTTKRAKFPLGIPTILREKNVSKFIFTTTYLFTYFKNERILNVSLCVFFSFR